jgi:hypothetical protein
MDNDLEIMWKEVVMAEFELFYHHLLTRLEEIWCQGWDLISATSEYKIGVLSIRQQQSLYT